MNSELSLFKNIFVHIGETIKRNNKVMTHIIYILMIRSIF